MPVHYLDVQTTLNVSPTTVDVPRALGWTPFINIVVRTIISDGTTTWTINMQWKDRDGTYWNLGSLVLSATNAQNNSLQEWLFSAPFGLAQRITTVPDRIVYTRTVGAGTLTCWVAAMIPDRV